MSHAQIHETIGKWKPAGTEGWDGAWGRDNGNLPNISALGCAWTRRMPPTDMPTKPSSMASAGRCSVLRGSGHFLLQHAEPALTNLPVPSGALRVASLPEDCFTISSIWAAVSEQLPTAHRVHCQGYNIHRLRRPSVNVSLLFVITFSITQRKQCRGLD